MNLREELRDSKTRWGTLNLYEKFEQIVLIVLTALISLLVAKATWHLVLTILALVTSNLVNPADYQVFQTVFGMIFTVLIALEFKHSLLVVFHDRRSIVQVKSVILIAMLALVRKFIIVDVHTMTPAIIAALAGAILALGLVYWLVRDQDQRDASRD